MWPGCKHAAYTCAPARLQAVSPKATQHCSRLSLTDSAAPLQTDFSQFSFQRYFRAAALMANGIEAVEPNPNFMSELTAASGGKPICVMCETGGSWCTSPAAVFGCGLPAGLCHKHYHGHSSIPFRLRASASEQLESVFIHGDLVHCRL